MKPGSSGSQAEAEQLNQSQSMGTCLEIGLSFRLCFRLRQSGFHKMMRSDSSNSDSVSCLRLRLRLRFLIFTRSSPFFSPAKEAKNADNYDNTNEKKKGPHKVFGKYMKTIQAEFSILSFQNFRL